MKTNVNCRHYDRYGHCNKQKRMLGVFKMVCPEVQLITCGIAERYPKPIAPPPPPQPKHIIARG